MGRGGPLPWLMAVAIVIIWLMAVAIVFIFADRLAHVFGRKLSGLPFVYVAASPVPCLQLLLFPGFALRPCAAR